MISNEPDLELSRLADEAADAYFRSLPPEHFMESTDHAMQRKITVESFDQMRASRPDIQCFNELLVQYFRSRRRKKFEGVVPDNMVVMHAEPIQAVGHYSIHEQPVGPFLVLEYISRHSKQKDYEDNFDRYEQDLKIPYYLLYYPGNQTLNVYKMVDGKYVAVEANLAGRLAIPELEVEVAVLEGWARFWFRGKLLPLGDQWKASMDEKEERLIATESKLSAAEVKLSAAEDQLEAERKDRQRAEERAANLEAELARAKEELAKHSKS